mmetsp:Transcript_43244/g.68431  ORF Transcript_43244/g.68431 Transcript_43244/m.68431 type:complete len:87 (-) Transcript_43244:915-1175(-)
MTGGGERALCGFTGEASLRTLEVTTACSAATFGVCVTAWALTTAATGDLDGPAAAMPKALDDELAEGRKPVTVVEQAATDDMGEDR